MIGCRVWVLIDINLAVKSLFIGELTAMQYNCVDKHGINSCICVVMKFIPVPRTSQPNNQ